MLNGEASSSEQEDLTRLLQHDEALQQQFELLVRIWDEKHGNINEEDNINADHAISRIISRASADNDGDETITVRKRRRKRRSIFLTCVCLVGIGITGWFLKNSTTSAIAQKTPQETIITKNGSRTRSLLADGTTVWLNVGSKLYYENDFNGATREVRLEGEAFFDVVKQAGRPFIVHTSGIDIRVLGTAFNVKSYPDDKNVETTLYRGMVQVVRQEESISKAIQLVPNQKLILPKQAANESVKLSETSKLLEKDVSNSFIITHIDSTKKESERLETAWLYSRLEFRGDSFEEVARKLERWYNVQVVFADEKVKQLNVTGTFEKETVEQAFAALKQAFPINFKINNHEISVESSQ